MNINYILDFFIKWFVKGSTRSVQAKRSILYILSLKVLSIISNILLVPITISYINPVQYGIWLTLSSVIAWISFFDIGFGNGLRNKLAEAIAREDITVAKEYVSTAYYSITLIFGLLYLILSVINIFLDWNKILNLKSNSNDLNSLVNVVLLFFCIRIILQLLLTICLAFQKPALPALVNLLGNLGSLIIIWILTKISSGSLYLLGSIYSVVPVIVLLIATVLLFKYKFFLIRPNVKFVKFEHISVLIGLGVKFFAIQISGIVTFSAMNFLINTFYSPLDVTRYNIAYKLFGIITMVYGIFLTPLWSATTDAFYKGDYLWIKKTLKKYNVLSSFLVCAIFLILILSDKLYFLWVGGKVEIPFMLSFAIAFDTIIYTIFSPYTAIINGIGKLKIVFYYVVFQTIMFIPLVYLSVTYLSFGVANILIVSISLKLPLIVLQIKQVKKLINGKSNGIWNE